MNSETKTVDSPAGELSPGKPDDVSLVLLKSKWIKSLCLFNQYGSSKRPELTDPVTKHLMTSRWPYETWARNVLTSELTWWRKEFITAYMAYEESETPLQIEATRPVLKLISGIGGDYERAYQDSIWKDWKPGNADS